MDTIGHIWGPFSTLKIKLLLRVVSWEIQHSVRQEEEMEQKRVGSQ